MLPSVTSSIAEITVLRSVSLFTVVSLSIIEETKESAVLRSAEFYLDAVEYAISTRILNGKIVKDGVYNILESGNICLGTLKDKTCNGDILEVKIDGERPNGEKITIKDGE